MVARYPNVNAYASTPGSLKVISSVCNAIDVKAGSDTPESTIIRRNRMWGFRRNAWPSGKSRGELLVLQNYCRNVLVEDNIMGEAPWGMKDENWLQGQDSEFGAGDPRNIVVRNNQFYEIHNYAAADAGAITKPVTAGVQFIDNYFARSNYLADITPPGAYQGGPPRYQGNTLVEVGGIKRDEPDYEQPKPPLLYDPASNTRLAFAPYGYDRYERKRWTVREFPKGAIPAAHASDQRRHGGPAQQA